MGRLRRNKQVGLFPSNFVEVLDDHISPSRPASRNGAVSPMFGGGGNISRAASPAPTHYSRAPSPQPPAHRYLGDHRSRSPMPYEQDDRRSRSPMPYQPGYHSRAASPNPYPGATSPNPYGRGTSPAPSISRREYNPRAASPAPPPHYRSRASSPAPSMMQYHRTTSPNPYMNHGLQDETTPPPAPPPHRYQRSSPLPIPERRRTPAPSGAHSPAMLGNTPSPLRNAMEDVMESLQHMTARECSRPQTPVDIWSPKAFALQYHSVPSARKSYVRPETSLGIGDRNDGYDEEPHMIVYPDNQRPNFNNYSERKDDRLKMFQHSNHPSARHRLDEDDLPPAPPPKNPTYDGMRPQTGDYMSLSNRKSMYDINDRRSPGPNKLVRSRPLSRTTTVGSNATSTQSSSTNATSVMSGLSAGGLSATSAGSLARRKEKAISTIAGSGISVQKQMFPGFGRSETPTFGSGGSSGLGPGMLRRGQTWGAPEATSGTGALGGLAAPKSGAKPKKTGFLKRILDSAKTSTASARSVAAGMTSPAPNSIPKNIPDGVNAISGGWTPVQQQSQDWVQVRRDVNRSNTLSRNERIERQEKQQLMDQIVLRPVDALDDDVDGDEAADGRVVENPVDFDTANLALVDKGARFIGNLPPLTTPESLAAHHVCRPYRSDLQRLRAIFTWVSEKISWEHPSGPLDNESSQGGMDPRNVIQQRRGGPVEVAGVVMGMCNAVGIHCEIVRGYLKIPGEALDVESCPRPNHWWNAVIIDGEWRFLDCSLASPTNPRRVMYSSAPVTQAEPFYFLTKPSHLCWTHVPLMAEQQHMVPSLPMAILLALPSACPPFFRHGLQMNSFDTSLTRIEDLEVAQIEFTVPIDVECIAEVEVRGFEVDQDGDIFESGEVVKKRSLCQIIWENGIKTYRVKAVLPGDEGHGVLKIYAGKRGLIVSYIFLATYVMLIG